MHPDRGKADLMAGLLLEGKVAIVTGGGQGIGRGVSLAFATEGAHVVIADKNQATATSTAGEVRERGVRSLAVQCDVTRIDDIRSTVAAAVAEFGRLDILVNNAMADPGLSLIPFMETTDEHMDKYWQSGPLATFHFMQVCYPHLRGHASAIVNVGSRAGIDGLWGYAAYGAAKEGIRALTKAAAREWGPDGIRVNAIAPYADSPANQLAQSLLPAATPPSAASTRPIARVGDCELDIGRTVVYLASDLSAFVTGHTVMVDGGSCRF
jgi:NAD(P)-dependent dehydrogenase (short-subunit alcohol dehydrogenase family)